MNGDDAKRLIDAIRDTGDSRCGGRESGRHRSIAIRLGADAGALIERARESGLIESGGRGRNRCHTLTPKGMGWKH